MGKKQHSQDRMYITATEWKRDFGGKKDAASTGDFPRLALDCCCLSFQPFEHPVCTQQGQIFELENIVPFIQKYHKNPVTNEPLELNQLIKLHFSRNHESNELQCPIMFKPFSENTHVVALKTTGNVYSYEAIDTLCLKTKSLRDLLDDSPFTRADIITLQDPNILARNPAAFAHIKDESVARQVDDLKKAGTSTSASSTTTSSASATSTAAKPATAPRARPQLGISLTATKPSGAAAAAAAITATAGPARAMYSSGAASGSFTSTAMSVQTKNERSLLTPEQILEQHYAHLKKNKAKGYVRLSTTLGNINLELAVDQAPRTCHNFLELCERGYYKDTIMHRVIPGFMVQMGDPTGTGRGGEGAFESHFNDEFNSALRHNARGVLAMANSGPNTNGSQFYITFDATPHLDNKHSVFGRVVGGMEVLDAIEKVETVKGKNEAKPKDCPKKDIKITACTVYTNPFKEAFVPVDELTRKKENEVEAKEEESEMGAWFSNPTAAGLKPPNDPNEKFKYLSLPKPIKIDADMIQREAIGTTPGGTSQTKASKRKDSPNVADENGVVHPAMRLAATNATTTASATPTAMDTSVTPRAANSSLTEMDEDALQFEAAKRRQQLAAAQTASASSSSYGNFGNW